MTKRTMPCWAMILVSAAMATNLVGCGPGRPKLVPVSGQVFLNGKPLAAGVDGFIQVIPADGRAATGTIDKSTGKFTLSTFDAGDGAIPGTHPATVIVNATAGMQTFSLIPEKYRDKATSGLTVTIDGPTQDLKVDLTGELKPAPKGGDKPSGDMPAVGL